MSDEEVVQALTVVKGIGQWTAEMILMFKLGRQDVMPATDLGVRKGYSIIFKSKELATPKAILEHSQNGALTGHSRPNTFWAAADAT